MRFIFIVLFGLLTVLVGTSVYAQTEEDVKKEADALFSSANYVEATPLYLRLLSLQPRDANYNYKYGTCLLYNSENKSSAFKYLNYAVKTGGVDNEAYYFLGKAYHLTFQFNKAIANFSKYQELAGEKALQRLDVNRQIEMCNNAKSLISNISELIVINKKQIDYNSFFRLYDLSNIGGTLIVTEEFQTKQDKKRDHLPLIHFPANPKRIFYSSYGEDGNGKDIYVRTRLPDNSWSLPMPVQGNVNTRYNEDYPYMHPDGRYLYFCSEGHNSMGGYDIFRSKYNADDNSFGPPENMDYAISSPDNDFFYVVDSLNKNAYFASQRESEDGKVHVYEVRVERFPVQIVIIKGQFSSTLNPGNKELEIEVYSASTDKQVGKFKTNKRGGYLINLPKGGKYEFKVRVGGKDTEYKQLIDVPFLKEFKPLKQRIDELQKDEGEIVTITNLFNEDFEDPVAVMAEIIQKRANLTPNVENYDLDSLDILAKNNKVLAQVGLNNFTEGEIKDLINSKVNDLTTLNQNIETSLVQNKNIQTELAQEANLLYKEINELIDASSSATNKETKKEKLNEAKEKFNELQTVLLKIESTKILEDQISAAQKNAKSELTQANQLKSDYDLASDSQSKLAAVVKNQSFVSSKLKKSTLLTTESIISSKIEQEIVKSQEVKKTIDDLNNQVTIIDSKINGINKKLNAAKKKEKEKLLTELNTLENEKLVISEEIVYQNTQVKNGYAPEEFLQAKLTLTELNNANTTLNETNTTLNLSFSDEDVLQKLNVIDEQIAQTSSQSNSKVETEINEITSVVNSNLYSDSELNETKEEIERKLKDSKQLLEELDLVNDNNDVSPEQFQKIKELKESIKKDIEKREKLLLTESTSSSEEISSSEITKLEKTSQQYKNELTETLQQLENEEITFEDSKKKSEAYLAQLENENNKLIKEISNKGMTDERSEKKAFLDKEIVEVQKNIAEIEPLEVEEEIYATLKQDYEQKLTAIQNSQKSDLEKLKESLTLEQKLSDRVNTKFDDIQKELLKNSNDITLKQQEWAANKILEDSKSRIEELNTSIEQLESEQAIANTSPEEKVEVDATEVLNEVLKSYATKTTEKATAYQNKEISTEEYLEFITENETKLSSEIASNSEKITELTAEINELESKENPTEKDLSKLKERKTTVEVLKQSNTILEQEKITVSTKKEQLESEQAIANTSPEEKVEVDATEVLNEVLKSYATKTTEKATAYQNKEISTEEYLEFITENEIKLSSEITSNNEKITELTAEINELESKETPTEKDLSKLKETKTTVEVLKQTNAILEQEKITVSTKKEQLESEQAIANTSPEEKVEVEATEVLNNIIPDYRKELEEANSQFKTGEITVDELINLKKEKQNTLKVKLTEIEEEIAAGNSVTENTEISKVVTKEIKRISIEIGELEIDRNDIVQKENEEKAKLYVFDLKKKYEEIDNLELNDLSNREYQELVNFDKQLENLEIDLKESKATLNLEDKVYQAEVKNQLDAEINKIEKQRRVISIEIGDLETELVTTVKPEVQQVLNSDDAAEIKLNEENVIAEQNKLNQLISENPGKQKKIEAQKVKVLKVENELLESTANSNQKFIDLNKTEVAKNAISSAKITQNEIEIASLENQLLDVKDEALKNSIRKEIVSKQNEIVEAISEAKIEEKIIDIYSDISENTSSETLKNPNGLKTNKDIEIETKNIENDLISLNVKIENLSKEIDSANKIDKLILVEKQNDLIELREVLNSKVLENNVELAKRNEVVAQDNSSGVEKESISTQISYEKELELASSDEYKELQKVSNQLDQVKYEAKVKRERIESKRIELQDFLKIQATIPSEENKQKITNTITEIEKIENDLKLLRIDLAALQLEINSNLPSDVTDRALVENLILRDVAPRDVKTQLQKPGELIQALSLGLNIDTESNKAELREEEIAINSDIPDGIVFRVQVGAFSKPVDKNTFTEFNPLSGEQIRAGLIRYMAGIFASKKDARIAQKSIRALGYSDAFVVAYCDQERIPVYRAEQLLASGACVSKIVSQEAVLVDNGTQLTEGNPNATVNTVEKLDQFSYNKAEGAAPAIAAESKQGLFFTVQVGVYNRPVSEEQLFNISPLVTLRLPNGQIRYSTGLFNSSLDAKPKQKDAIEKGVDDAFITAYYKGERIGVSKARKLLAEFGDVILEEKSPTVVEKGEVVENVELPDPIVPVVDKNEIEVKYFSKETYKEFPTQVLNRLNETGVNFYYNTSSNKIETGLLSNNEITKINSVEDEFESSEYYLGRKIKDVTATNPSDALYNSSIPQYALYVKILGENINAGLMNRVYALGINYSISSSNGNTTITFISSGNSTDLKLIKQKLLSFNIAEMTIVRLKQTEF